MRENIVPVIQRGSNNRLYIENDWYSRGLPANVAIAENVYMDTSFGFEGFHSKRKEGLFINEASGCYGVVTFTTSEKATISVGRYCVLNEATLICNDSITIGDHCMLAWGSIVTDTWSVDSLPVSIRQQILYTAAHDPLRRYPITGEPSPVVLEDNCWVGFESVILPGVRLGRGCIVGSKTIVTQDVPPYAVMAGSPAKIVKYLDADDTTEAKEAALQEYLFINQ